MSLGAVLGWAPVPAERRVWDALLHRIRALGWRQHLAQARELPPFVVAVRMALDEIPQQRHRLKARFFAQLTLQPAQFDANGSSRVRHVRSFPSSDGSFPAFKM